MLMSKSAVDYYADVNQQRLHKLSRLITLPSFVETSPVADPKEAAALPIEVFADPVSRKFPLHTKAATWLAQAYFSHDRHLYTNQQAISIQGKIDKAAQYWSISEFTKQARSEVDAFTSSAPPALADADYALVIEQDGKKHPMLPIHSPENVKAAAATLYNQRGNTPYEWRVIGARKILHKAAALGVKLEDDLAAYLTKAAGLGSSFPTRAAARLANRVLMIPDSQKAVKVAAAKLAKTVDQMTGLPSAATLVKLATIVDRLDREQGFTKYYDEAGLDTPEEIFFELTHEKAAQIRDSYLMLSTGVAIPFEALQKAPLAKIAGALGFLSRVQSDNSLDVSIEKFAGVAATLPRDDAALLTKMLKLADVPIKEPTAAELP
jgi:hypothetical protein